MGNPSDPVETPLTGGYLLIVLAEPRSAEQKLAILKRLTKGLSCWNFDESGVELAIELNAVINQNIEGEEGKNGEQLFQYASENIVAEILVNPQHSTLVQCVRNLLASFTKYRCVIYAGYSFTENGSWILQDGSFSVADFLDAYKTAEAQRTVRLHENQIRIELHCSNEAEWVQACRVKGTRFLLNPMEKIVETEAIELFVRWLCDKIEVVEIDVLLEGSQVVGNIRFSRPTLYVFPAGQGDSALFGINGFNMLIDGGAGRNSCFWGFARHLDRLDAVLLTRLNVTNLEGIASFIKRKTLSSLYPQIGHFFCNFKTRKQVTSQSIDVKHDVLSISLIDTAQSLISDLKQLQLRPHLCYRNINLEPINLYHKVGHGKLDMYVLNPSKESKEVKDFLTKWNEGDQKLFNLSKDLQFPLHNVISICTLLVWQPANPNTTITRILFPGSNPQNKIFEALDRVRHLEFLRHPSCSIKSMSSFTSTTNKSQPTKKTVLEKMIPGETKTIKTMENLEVSATALNTVIQTAIIPTIPKEGTPKPKSTTDAEKLKTSLKTSIKEIPNTKPKIDYKYNSIAAKVNSNKAVQKSATLKKTLKLSIKSPPTDKSSPTTPTENQEKTPRPVAVKPSTKPKTISSTIKSPSSTPSKSKKEEANRKVLVSSRTNSGLKRTQATKKETKPSNLKNTEICGTTLKSQSNVVYKSSLISGNIDKSGEEEDILIIEKVAVTPEKRLTPDGKKIIAHELDGILTTAKNIVTKEKCTEKLSDSGSTAPSMPENEKATEFKTDGDINKVLEKEVEELKKTKNSLKTPDEVADLPLHEEADEQKFKAEEKETTEAAVMSENIIQVENAEYVLVSSDSSPEVLKRQVQDTVGLLSAEFDEDTDKEDEYEETKETITNSAIDEKDKLIEHLLESSKDLCEITEKIDDLKKQNDQDVNKLENKTKNSINNNSSKNATCDGLKEINNGLKSVVDANINKNESNTISSEKNNTQMTCIDKQDSKTLTREISICEQTEDSKKNSSMYDELIKTPVVEYNFIKKVPLSPSNSVCQEQENIHKKVIENEELQMSNKVETMCDKHIISSDNGKKIMKPMSSSQSGFVCQNKANLHETDNNIKKSNVPIETGSTSDEEIEIAIQIENTTKQISTGQSSSARQEPEYSHEIGTNNQESDVPSKTNSTCNTKIKSLVDERNVSKQISSSRSGSLCQDQENLIETDKKTKKTEIPSSISDENEKPSVDENNITKEIISSRTGLLKQKQEDSFETDKDAQKTSESRKGTSISDENINTPADEKNVTKQIYSSGSGSVCQDQENSTDTELDTQNTKISSHLSDENIKLPVDDKNLTTLISSGGLGSICQKQESLLETQNTKVLSQIPHENIKSPIDEINVTKEISFSQSDSVCQNLESSPETDKDPQKTNVSRRTSSVTDKSIKSPVDEKNVSKQMSSSRSDSICQDFETLPETEKDTKKTNISRKTSLISDKNNKTQVDKKNETKEISSSRSDSVCQDLENSPETDKEAQKTNVSRRASSVSDKSIKSPVNEKNVTKEISPSRSDSLCQDLESSPETDKEAQKTNVSRRASSVSDKSIKSPVNEKNVTKEMSSSRSDSVCQNLESPPETDKETQKTNVSRRASSVSDKSIKSPVDEINVTKEISTSRSDSVCQDLESSPKTDKETQKTNVSRRASSVSDKSIKSPVDEKNVTKEISSSRSDSVCQNLESSPKTDKETQKTYISKRASSVSDNNIKSQVDEKNMTKEMSSSRSDSVCQDLESSPETAKDTQKINVSRRGSLVSDKNVKSLVDEKNVTKEMSSSRSDSVCQDLESPPETDKDTQITNVSRRASLISDKNIKSPVDEINVTKEISSSRSDSICQDAESSPKIDKETQETNVSRRASSISDKNIKTPVDEINVTKEIFSSRSGSICQDSESSPETDKETQKTNISRRASSISDKNIKSQLDEINVTKEISTSRSDSVCQDLESSPETDKETQKTNISRRASSISDKNIKTPIDEINVTKEIFSSRSDSICQDSESSPETDKDTQKTNVSRRTSSISDKNIKSLLDEINVTKEISTSRSDSVCQDLESSPKTDKETQKTNVSRRASSISDKNIKSPLDEINVTKEISSIRSDSICQDLKSSPETHKETQKTNVSRRASSISDKNIETPIDEINVTKEIFSSRSDSICQDSESSPETDKDTQKTNVSRRTSLASDKNKKSPVDEIKLTGEISSSRSDSVCQDLESPPETDKETQKSNVSRRTSSVSEKNKKSPVDEKNLTKEMSSNRSDSVCQYLESSPETDKDTQKTNVSRRTSLVSDKNKKSPVDEKKLTEEISSSRSDSVCQDLESPPETDKETQKSNVSRRTSSVSEKNKKSPVDEKNLTKEMSSNRSDFVCQDLESSPETDKDTQKTDVSRRASSVSDNNIKSPVDEKNMTKKMSSSRSDSVCQDLESSPETDKETQKTNVSRRTSSVSDKSIKSPVDEKNVTKEIPSSRSDSLCQDLESSSETDKDTQKTNVSRRASSVSDKSIKSPVDEKNVTKEIPSSRSDSLCQDLESSSETDKDTQKTNVSRRTSSVSDKNIKSPVHEKNFTKEVSSCRSESVCQDLESFPETAKDTQETNVSRRTSSVSEKNKKSPVDEKNLTKEMSSNQSDSVCQDLESSPETDKDTQKTNVSRRASSVSDNNIKSPVDEKNMTKEMSSSRSDSVCQDLESLPETDKDTQKTNVSLRTNSTSDKNVKSLVDEKNIIKQMSSSRSDSVCQDQEGSLITDKETKKSEISSFITSENIKSLVDEVDSISDENSKSPLNEKNIIKRISSSQSNSLCHELITSQESDHINQESKTSLCNKTLQSPPDDISVAKNMSSSLSNSNCQDVANYHESIAFEDESAEFSIKDGSIDVSFKEQETVSLLSMSRNNSICQKTESTSITDTDKHDFEATNRKYSFGHDKNKFSTMSSSSRNSSLSQEMDSESSTFLRTNNSFAGEIIDKSLNLQITDQISSVQQLDNSINNESIKECSDFIPTNENESQLSSKNELFCEKLFKSPMQEYNDKENLTSSRSSSICEETEKQKSPLLSRKNSLLLETKKLLTPKSETVLSSSDSDKIIFNEENVEETKSLGRIGSLCEEIAKFLTEDDKKTLDSIRSESICKDLSESISHESNIEKIKIDMAMLSTSKENLDNLIEKKCLILNNINSNKNDVKKYLKLDDKNQIDNTNDDVNIKNKDDCLPNTNITVSNIDSPNISTLLIEENNKTGKINVAQVIEKNIDNESSTKHILITTKETENLKTDTLISNITLDEGISKLSNVLIEDIVKGCDKNVTSVDDLNSTVTEINVKQSLSVVLNNEDLGVTKDVVIQLKRDVHDALYQCSSDDERPFTPHSESSMSRSTMNIDDDDERNETDDEMPESSMSTGPSPMTLQLDNRQTEIHMDFSKALQEHKITRGEDLTTTETNGNLITEIKTTEHDNINQNQGTSTDTVQSWGKPLGLPPIQSLNNNGFDPIREWGKPLGLPSPTQPVNELTEQPNISNKTTPKKNMKKAIDNKPLINVIDKDAQNRIRRSESPNKLRSRSSSRMSRINPVYVDLIYVPHHGNSKYVSADFFKRVRARNYVFSGTDPSKEVLNALIEGKQAWEDQDLEVTIIPTYDTDTLGQWMAENEELLAKLKIDLSPSASRCTIKLQDHNTSCSAYRLEF